MNIWTIIGTILGALIAGLSVLLNSIYSSKSIQKREDRNRLINEKDRDIKDLEHLYERSLHLLDRLIRKLGSLPSSDLEEYYGIEIKLELISTDLIVEKIKELRNGISIMGEALPDLPEEFIPKFEEDSDRRLRLEKRKKANEKRETKSEEFIPGLRKTYNELSELMKRDLQDRRLFNVEEYIKYRKKN
jgi:hypothetical protein